MREYWNDGWTTTLFQHSNIPLFQWSFEALAWIYLENLRNE
jgi:hypothetical protein